MGPRMATASGKPNSLGPKLDASTLAAAPELKDKSYWEARLAKNWGLQGAGYLGHGARYNKWLYAVRREVLRRHLWTSRSKYPKRASLILAPEQGFGWNKI